MSSLKSVFSLFLYQLFILTILLFPNQFAAKNLERNSKKCEKEEKAEKLKLKKVSRTYIKVVKKSKNAILVCLLAGACN